PLDPRERTDCRFDRRALARSGEVRAQPGAQVARLADIENRVVHVAEEVDARSRRRPGDEVTLSVQPARARRRELHDVTNGACTSFLGEPEQKDENLGSRDRVRKRTMAGPSRHPEEMGKLCEREALPSPVAQAPGAPDGGAHRRSTA